HLYFDLEPTRPGQLRIAKLQLPNGRSWGAIAARTSYENKNLFLRDLVLDEQTRLAVVNIDASKIDTGKLDVAVQGTFAGAKIDTTIALGEAEKSLETRLNFVVEDSSLEAIGKYLEPPKLEDGRIKEPEVGAAHPEPPNVTGTVRRMAVNATGQLDKPASWSGSVNGEVENLSVSGLVFDRVVIDATAEGGRAAVKTLELTRGDNRITLQGTADLPMRTEEFGRVPANFQLRANVPDLRSLTAGMPQPITGPAEVNGQINVRDATVHVDLAAVAGPVDFGQGSVQRAVLRLRAAKRMPPPMPDEEDVGRETIPPPFYANLESNIAVEVSEVRFAEYAVDALTADLRTVEKDVTLEQLSLNRGENRIVARGRYELPAESGKALSQPGSIAFDVQAPEVAQFWIGDAAKVSGSVYLNGGTDLGATLSGGYFNLKGTNLRAQKLTVPEVSAHGTIAGNIVYLNDLTARLNDRDYVAANGTAGIKAPYPYSGALSLNVADLSTFESFLGTPEKKTELAGALAVNWHGNGTVSDFKNTGDVKLTLKGGRFDTVDKVEATIDANYTPEELNVPIIYAASDKLMFQAIMQAKGSTLEMTKIQVIQGEAKYADGYVSVPFVWGNVGTDRPLFPTDGQVMVNFQTQNLEIDK
ncbi:MAG TPA: hypothetical protein VF683_05325, partial [Chthoniobacterales bacterium]